MPVNSVTIWIPWSIRTPMTEATRGVLDTSVVIDHDQIDAQYRQERDKHDSILQAPGRVLIILGG